MLHHGSHGVASKLFAPKGRSALVLNNTRAWGLALHAQPSTSLPLHTRVCRFFSLTEGFSRPPLSTQKSPPVKDPTHTISAMGAPSRKWA